MARRGIRTAVSVAAGTLGLAIGGVLSLRPVASPALAVPLLVVGLVAAAAVQFAAGSAPPRWSQALGLVHVAAAALILGRPGVAWPVCAVAVGLVLVVSGATEVWAAASGRVSWSAGTVGALTLVLGCVATLWADAVILPMMVALGWRLVVVSAGLLVDAWCPGAAAGNPARRAAGRAVAGVLAVALTAAGLAADHQRGAIPDFYDAGVPATASAGTLLKAQSYPDQPAIGTAVRLLYVTVDADGTLLPASAVLYLPAATSGPRVPVVVWAHDSTGVERSCAPSLLGEEVGGLTATAKLLAAGYAVLAPDLPGLGTSGPSGYLVGVAEGHAVLDALRAAGQVPGMRVGQSVLWGEGAGGHAALWAAQVAARYAPGIELSGTVAFGPFSDLPGLFAAQVAQGRAGTTGAYLAQTYTSRYPQVLLADFSSANPALVAEVATRCDGNRGLLGRAWASAAGFEQAWRVPSASSALGQRLAENTPSGPFATPVLVLQGAADDVAPAVVQDGWVDARCSAGERLAYQKFAGLGHADLVQEDGPAIAAALVWTSERFAGRVAAVDCG